MIPILTTLTLSMAKRYYLHTPIFLVYSSSVTMCETMTFWLYLYLSVAHSIQASAEQFYSTYNGQLYNSIEKAVCQLVYVSKVEIKRSSQGASLPSAGMVELPSCPVCLERLVGCFHSYSPLLLLLEY